MDCMGRENEDRAMLHRIVALLFALADLAERASANPEATRRFVLWILYPAEAVARAMVVSAYGPATLPDARLPLSDARPEDALRLAICFRMLALLLEAVANEALDEPVAMNCMTAVSELSRLLFASRSREALSVPAQICPDTS